MLQLEDCVVGRIYKIQSQHLLLSVYAGSGTFIGVRMNGDHQQLVTEYHHSLVPFGTVHSIMDTRLSIPRNIKLLEDDDNLPLLQSLLQLENRLFRKYNQN